MICAPVSIAQSWLSFEGHFAQRPFRRGAEPNVPAQDSAPGIYMQKVVSKPVQRGQGYKFGIFAGLHGDEEAGVLAVQELVRWANTHPHLPTIARPPRSVRRWSGGGLNVLPPS